mgnify:CR=1 FL=1
MNLMQKSCDFWYPCWKVHDSWIGIVTSEYIYVTRLRCEIFVFCLVLSKWENLDLLFVEGVCIFQFLSDKIQNYVHKTERIFFFLHFGQKFKFQFFKLTITTLNFRAKFDLDFTHWVENQNWPVFWRQNSKLSQNHYFAKYGAKIQMWKSGI